MEHVLDLCCSGHSPHPQGPIPTDKRATSSPCRCFPRAVCGGDSGASAGGFVVFSHTEKVPSFLTHFRRAWKHVLGFCSSCPMLTIAFLFLSLYLSLPIHVNHLSLFSKRAHPKRALDFSQSSMLEMVSLPRQSYHTMLVQVHV